MVAASVPLEPERGAAVRDPGTDETLQSIIQVAHSLIDMPAALWLPRLDGDELSIRAQVGLPGDWAASARARRGDGGLIDQAFAPRAVVSDLSGDPVFAREAPAAGWKASLVLPVASREQTVGALQVFNPRGEDFQGSEIESLTRFVEIVGVVLGNVRRSAESEELAQLANTLSSKPDFESAMREIVDSARRLTGADSSTIVLYERGTNTFLVGSRSPQEGLPEVIPRRERGLTKSIIDSGESVLVEDTETDWRANPELLKHGVRSMIGVRLQLAGERFGVLYVESRRARHFTSRDLDLLRTAADQASVALGWTRLLLEPWTVIEQSTASLFQLDEILESLCQTVNAEIDFEYSTVQLVRRDKNIIETAHATGIAKRWEGRSRHYLHEDEDLRDIQADIALRRPLRIEILRGKDPRFDQGIFESFDHKQLTRIFAPLAIVRTYQGEPLESWTMRCGFKVIEDSRTEESRRLVIELELPDVDGRPLDVQVMGTIEGGLRQNGRELGVADARALVELSARHAQRIWSTQLDHVLETIVKQALRIARADSASLHFPYDKIQARYLHEVRSGGLAADFLKQHPPRPGGLGVQAIEAKKPRFLPDPASGDDDSALERQRPELAEAGIRAMAAFPLFVGNDAGVLYLHFHRSYRFREDEAGWVQLLANRASDAIRHAIAYTEARDRTRQLVLLQSVAQSLASGFGEDQATELLVKIASNTLNTLAADVVTIYEYKASEGRFETPPSIAGRLRSPTEMHTQINEDDAPVLLVRYGKDIFVPSKVELDPILSGKKRQRPGREVPYFAVRESIKSSAGILLKVGDEIVGIMFINYRRPHRFSPEDRRIIEALASAAAIAIKNQRLLEKRQEDLMTITHHLLGPLSTVSGSLSILKSCISPDAGIEDVDPLPVSLSFYEDLDRAYALCEDVVTLSRGVLSQFARDMGRRTSSTTSLGAIDVPKEVRLLCQRLQTTNLRSGLRFEYQSDPDFPVLRFDRQTFSTVVYSLVHNALKYAFQNTSVKIACRYDRRSAKAFVEVRSIGERIEPSEKDLIFEKYQRGRAVSLTGRHHSGVGLGLWVARQSMKDAGGDLRLKLSETDPQEVCFIVEIPIGKD